MLFFVFLITAALIQFVAVLIRYTVEMFKYLRWENFVLWMKVETGNKAISYKSFEREYKV